MNLGARQKWATLHCHCLPSSTPAVEHLNFLIAWSRCSWAAGMWPEPQPGKGTTRRDAADMSTKAWQLLWEPTAMLPHPKASTVMVCKEELGAQTTVILKAIFSCKARKEALESLSLRPVVVFSLSNAHASSLLQGPGCTLQCESNPASQGWQGTSPIHPL